MPFRDVETGEKTPLLGRRKKSAQTEDSLKETVVLSVACAAFITSFLSILFQPYLAVLISSMLGILIAPYTALQQQRITLAEELHARNERVEEEVRALAGENEALQFNISEAKETVSHLNSLQNALDAIRGLERTSASSLDEQLDLARRVLREMKSNPKPLFVQTLMNVLISAEDDSNSFILSDSEINELIGNLGSISGVQLNENLARKTLMEHGRSTGAIMAMAQNILLESKKEKIVVLGSAKNL